MDLKTSKYLHLEVKNSPFDDSFLDPVCKINLKETTDLVNLFPMAKKDGAATKSNLIEAPPTPAHHLLHGIVKSPDFVSRNCSNGGGNGFVVRTQRQENHHRTEVSSGITNEKVSEAVLVIQEDHHHHNSHRPFNGVPSDVFLKDQFTNGSEPDVSRFKCVVPINEGYQLSSMKDASTKVVDEVKRRDIGTNTTPPRTSMASQRRTLLESFSLPPNNIILTN